MMLLKEITRNGSHWVFWTCFRTRSYKIIISVSKKIDFISNPGGKNQGGQLLQLRLLGDWALKLHKGLVLDIRFCLILSHIP